MELAGLANFAVGRLNELHLKRRDVRAVALDFEAEGLVLDPVRVEQFEALMQPVEPTVIIGIPVVTPDREREFDLVVLGGHLADFDGQGAANELLAVGRLDVFDIMLHLTDFCSTQADDSLKLADCTEGRTSWLALQTRLQRLSGRG